MVCQGILSLLKTTQISHFLFTPILTKLYDISSWSEFLVTSWVRKKVFLNFVWILSTHCPVLFLIWGGLSFTTTISLNYFLLKYPVIFYRANLVGAIKTIFSHLSAVFIVVDHFLLPQTLFLNFSNTPPYLLSLPILLLCSRVRFLSVPCAWWSAVGHLLPLPLSFILFLVNILSVSFRSLCSCDFPIHFSPLFPSILGIFWWL